MKIIKSLTAIAAVAAIGISAPGVASAAPPFNIIVGTLDSDLLVGTPHNDWIIGRAGDDELIGRRGRDILGGRRGNDILRGWSPGGSGMANSGPDVLLGGSGVDICIGDSSDRFRGCETVIVRPD